MNLETQEQLTRRLFNDCEALLFLKGKDYGSQEDVLSNFKQNAQHLGLTKYQVWLVYFSKHIDSIRNAIRSCPENPQVESEPLKERIKDVINYAALLYCLLEEDEGETPSELGPFRDEKEFREWAGRLEELRLPPLVRGYDDAI